MGDPGPVGQDTVGVHVGTSGCLFILTPCLSRGFPDHVRPFCRASSTPHLRLQAIDKSAVNEVVADFPRQFGLRCRVVWTASGYRINGRKKEFGMTYWEFSKSRNIVRAAAFIGLLWMSGMMPASATLIDAIQALKPGDGYRVAFVTSAAFNATSTTIDTYNIDVQTAALRGTAIASLGLTWHAFVSAASTSATENTGITPGATGTVYFFNTRGDIIATSNDDLLDGALLQPISFDENGDVKNTKVWTGSNADGTVAAGDSLGSPVAIYGNSNDINSAWVDVGIASISLPFSLYGVSSLATIHSPTSSLVSSTNIPIPEPDSVFLVGIGLSVLALRHRQLSRQKPEL